MTLRSELVHAAGFSVQEYSERLFSVLKKERSDRATQMALVEEMVEVFVRINAVRDPRAP